VTNDSENPPLATRNNFFKKHLTILIETFNLGVRAQIRKWRHR